MPDQAALAGTPDRVVITGLGVTSAFGRGAGPLAAALASGTAGFAEVTRFGTERCRVNVAATLPGSPRLAQEIAAVVADAAACAGLSPGERAQCTLLVALHSDAAAARDPAAPHICGGTADTVAAMCGLSKPPRIYATACVAATSAIADAAAMISRGGADRVIVAAGYLVDQDSFWLFDAGRALAGDGRVRPFSAGRKGMLLGDGIAAVVLESGTRAQRRDARVLATLVGWGRAGDAYHVCDPRPDGAGLARAITSALARAHLTPDDIGYVNANGTGTPASDRAEAAALRLALGSAAGQVPVSSTKSLHGHALEASGLLEFAVTITVMASGSLPVNAGYLGPDPECELDLVLGGPRPARSRYALSVNAAFGGANTALVVQAA